MSLITIEQLLESVDLDFEPRFITQDEDGDVWIWNTRPDKNANWCLKKGTPKPFRGRFISECLKLAEFNGKDWTECIYEVPRKTTGKIEKLEKITTINHSTEAAFGMSVHYWLNEIIKKQGEIVDAVNELKEKDAK